MDLGLRDKVALVPASSQGLGRAVAETFLREGASVTMCGREGVQIDPADNLLTLAADVTKPDDIARLVSATVERFGGLDILILNAGGPPPGTFDSFAGDAAWEAAFNLTLMSAVRLIRASLPHMRARGGGRIVAMGSSSIKQPIPNLLLSNVMRAGVGALIKTLADELAADNIRCNTVLPGRIATRRILQLDQANAARQGVDEDTVRQHAEGAIPMRRYGEPQEFANMVVWVASDAASYVTGATLQVDGGAMRSVW